MIAKRPGVQPGFFSLRGWWIAGCRSWPDPSPSRPGGPRISPRQAREPRPCLPEFRPLSPRPAQLQFPQRGASSVQGCSAAPRPRGAAGSSRSGNETFPELLETTGSALRKLLLWGEYIAIAQRRRIGALHEVSGSGRRIVAPCPPSRPTTPVRMRAVFPPMPAIPQGKGCI